MKRKRRFSCGGDQCAGKKRGALSCLLLGMRMLLAGAALWSLWSFYASANGLSVTYDTFDSGKLKSPLRVVQLSDLHSHVFGKRNERLLEAVREQEPDLVFCTGDMLNENDADSGTLPELLRDLRRIAPVYVSLGNHELSYMARHHSQELIQEIRDAGAVFLEEEYVDVTTSDGGRVRIGGMYGYAFGSNGVTDEQFLQGSTAHFLEEFQDTDALRLLLVHRPDSFYFGGAWKQWQVDMIFSGHWHGGQVRLPLAGGIYGGDLGWFSDFVDGMHSSGTCNMVVSRGLGTSIRYVPRWNNVPEIVVMELT